MKRTVAVVVLAVVGAVGSFGTSSADATFPGRNGEVMYSWLDVSGKALWSSSGVGALATRTKRERNLVTCSWDNMHTGPNHGNCAVYGAAVSPDGRSVAVVVGDPVGDPVVMTYRLLLVTTAGVQLRSLPLEGPAFDPAWSPAGDQLLVTRYPTASGWRAEGSPRLALLDADGREIGAVGGEGASDADWAVSGEIAYIQDGDVWAVRLGGSPRRLTTGGRSPSWSPDGRKLAFERGGRIWTVRADGTRERRLANVFAAEPVWSPDGRYVAFGRPGGWLDNFGLGSIRVMRADGRCPHVLRRAWGWTGYGYPLWRSLPGSAPKRLGPPPCDRRAKRQRAAKRRAAKRCRQRQRAAKSRGRTHRCGRAARVVADDEPAAQR